MDTPVTLKTYPEKARCKLDGSQLKRVVFTPITVSLPLSASPVAIRCSAEGYYDEVTINSIKPAGQYGLHFLTGLRGGLVNAFSSAGQLSKTPVYSSQLSLELEPKGFKTTADRDAWYEHRRNLIERQYAGKFPGTRHAVDCDVGNDDSKRKCFKEKYDSILGELKRRRDSVPVCESPAANSGAEVSNSVEAKSFADASERELWYARTRCDVLQKFGRLMDSQRTERNLLNCYKPQENADSQECRAVIFQIGVSWKNQCKELAALISQYRSARFANGDEVEMAPTNPPAPESIIYFDMDKPLIEEAIINFYDMAGYTVDYPESSGKMTDLKSVTFHKMLGD